MILLAFVFVFSVSLMVFAGSEKEAGGEVEEQAPTVSDEPCVDEWVFPNLMFMTGGWAPYGEMVVWGMKQAIEEDKSQALLIWFGGIELTAQG